MTAVLSIGLALFLACTGAAAIAQGPTGGDPQRAALSRSKLECLLKEQQRKRSEILAEQRKVEAHLAKIEVFRRNLDPLRNPVSRARAEEAIRRDRSALEAIAAQLTQTDVAISQTERAIRNLSVPQAVKAFSDRLREVATPRLAAALGCDPDAPSSVADDPLAQRLIAADLCGERLDAEFVGLDGVSTDTAAKARVERIVDRLDSAGAKVPVVVLEGCPPEGGGAFATGSTAFIGECLLGSSFSDDEVAFIIAHERAHVRLQHVSVTYVVKAWDRFINGAIPAGLGAKTSDENFVSDVLAARLGYFDRDQEHEADLVGATEALLAGFSSRGITQFLARDEHMAASAEAARLARLSPEARARDASDTNRAAAERMRSSHPNAKDRQKALEAAFGGDLWKFGVSITCP